VPPGPPSAYHFGETIHVNCGHLRSGGGRERRGATAHRSKSRRGLMISVGHRTRILDVTRELPPTSSEDIAEWVGLNERRVREWVGALLTAGGRRRCRRKATLEDERRRRRRNPRGLRGRQIHGLLPCGNRSLRRDTVAWLEITVPAVKAFGRIERGSEHPINQMKSTFCDEHFVQAVLKTPEQGKGRNRSRPG
jgi:hypothetical protein